MKRRVFPVFFLLTALLLCAALSGCMLTDAADTSGDIFTDISAAIRDNDPDAFHALLYPGTATRLQAAAALRDMRHTFTAETLEQARRASLDTSRKTANGAASLTVTTVYRVPMDGKTFAIRIEYLETDDGHGITDLRYGEIESTVNVPALLISIWDLLRLAAIIWAIIDIVRIRPHLYGWYIVLVLLSFSLNFGSFRFAIPLGLLIYLAKRRSLREKATLNRS